MEDWLAEWYARASTWQVVGAVFTILYMLCACALGSWIYCCAKKPPPKGRPVVMRRPDGLETTYYVVDEFPEDFDY